MVNGVRIPSYNQSTIEKNKRVLPTQRSAIVIGRRCLLSIAKYNAAAQLKSSVQRKSGKPNVHQKKRQNSSGVA